MYSRRSAWIAAVMLAFLVVVVASEMQQGGSDAAAAAAVSASSGIVIPPPGRAPTIPPDILGGAPNATLTQAATFAWNEFIAATWPAKASSPGVYVRDVGDPNAVYGKAAASASGPPLVWETFRHKVEIFPGTTSSNNAQNTPPHGATKGPPDFGYNDPPRYNYATMANLNTASIGPPQYGPAVTGPCPGQNPNVPTAWVNLDENSQIFLDTMYAGAAPQIGPQPTPSQEILFLAKANHVHYQYTVNPLNAGGRQLYQAFWNHSFNGTANPNYVAALQNFANYQGAVLNGQQAVLRPPYISFPPNTVEAKSAWRQLTPVEAASGRFHMAMVRTYHTSPHQLYRYPSNSQACWTQQPWGMLALHIIQKTPSAPYFIYATFSQADNIQNRGGQRIEDANGNIVRMPDRPSSGSALDNGSVPNPNPITPTPATPSAQQSYVPAPQCQPGGRLYLINAAGPFTPQGPICVNARAHPIPQEIINVNAIAHNVINAYNQRYNGGAKTPWLFYKLVNVQAAPINKSVPGVPYTGKDSATFYLSNEVVETNYVLQFFSGRLANEAGGQLSSDYIAPGSVTLTRPPSTPFKNTFFLQRPNGAAVSTYNMGGCMGCHGNAQQAGADFSFIMNVGRNDAPDVVPSPTTSMAAQALITANKVTKFRLPH
jgi:hypothetical protein